LEPWSEEKKVISKNEDSDLELVFIPDTRTQTEEMEFVLVSVKTTRLEGIGLIAKRNEETAAQLYAGKIEYKPEQLVCISRRKVGMHVFRAVLDIYASLRSTSQGVCMLDEAPIPLHWEL